MNNKYLGGNLILAVLAILSCVGLYMRWSRGEDITDSLVSLGLIVIIAILSTVTMKIENDKKKDMLRIILSGLMMVFGMVVIIISVVSICSRTAVYSENAELYSEITADFSEMPTIEEIKKSEGSEFYTYTREGFKDSATAIIQYDAESYLKKLLELYDKYGYGDTLIYDYDQERGQFTLDGYVFILVDDSRTINFEKSVLIGRKGSERKIAYICYENKSYDDPLVKYQSAGRSFRKRIISMESFVSGECGWERHKKEQLTEQTTE